ncbi:TerB N-terminal domain-containing protein [Methylomonas sp. MED-D]|uniref:TerB N-terminal domain-containing protein n=1 Tax=Methylomonas sp. MED-D TaxID=3418768 RepID=UPI003D05928F
MSLLNKLIPRTKTNPAINKIPPYRKELLFISYDKPKDHGFGLQFTISISEAGDVDLNQEVSDDPSTIYAVLPAIDPPAPDNVEKLSYFPSYSGMNPEQRGLYLRWLYDVTAEIDVGYVFVYYYGLERQLVYGDFDAAFDEIKLLRRHHDNGSFQGYSASALVHSCLLRKRADKLQELYTKGDFDYFGNSSLLILYSNNLEILPDMMFQLATHLSGVNRRYIKQKPELYKEKIREVLINKFENAGYPLASRFSLDEVEGIPYPIFANISFPPEVRSPRLPNLLRNVAFQDEMGMFFKEIHEAVKSESARKRKNT